MGGKQALACNADRRLLNSCKSLTVFVVNESPNVSCSLYAKGCIMNLHGKETTCSTAISVFQYPTKNEQERRVSPDS